MAKPIFYPHIFHVGLEEIVTEMPQDSQHPVMSETWAMLFSIFEWQWILLRELYFHMSLPVYQSVLLPRLKAASKHLSWGQARVNPLLLGSFLPTWSCINFNKNNCRAHSFRTCSSEIFLYTFHCRRVCSWTFFQRDHTFKMGPLILKTHTVTLNIISIDRNMHFVVWDNSEEPIYYYLLFIY